MTSLSNCIKLLLNIKDPNLEFLAFKSETIDSVVTTVAYCNLKLPTCPDCHSAHIWRNGYAPVKVRYLSSDASRPLMLKLAKQRIICRDCGQSAMAQTSLVDKYCSIAIAAFTNVSVNTVQRVLEQYSSPFHDDDTWLPEHLAFDEFRSVGRKLHFIALDASTHQIVKILPTRYKQTIMTYFKHYPELVRRQVKTVSMDLNYYYAAMVKELFPNAQVVLDRFHIVQMLNRSFNACRIQVMKQYPKSSRSYRLLKYSWKLYLKPFDQLERKRPGYNWHLKDRLTQAQVVANGLALDPTLENTYSFMQDLRQALKEKDVKQIRTCLKRSDKLGRQMEITRKTFKRCLPDLLNAAKYSQSNGCLEGTNRKIKQIERTAYGYRNFNHLVARIKQEEPKAVVKKRASSYLVA